MVTKGKCWCSQHALHKRVDLTWMVDIENKSNTREKFNSCTFKP